MNTKSTTFSDSLVYLVDDDEAVLDAISLLLDSMSIPNQTYPNAISFLEAFDEEDFASLTGCIVLDIRMPGMSGMECQQKLKTLNCSLPIIFLSGHGDVPLAVEAMKQGAVEFIQKPFREQVLLDCIQHVLATNQAEQNKALQQLEIQKRIDTLTKREKQIMKRVIAGQANKLIADELNLSQRTIEIHRANVMEKMQANSLAELVVMGLTCQ
ncbi:response regulator transcription factor [Paraglaciecola sp. 2405UD69-4]|uniref:response regulator transcription factor n=1 Tax=Paraglaciecola sp. 2405UD69-4 TaxID=3391836 RepID=UPI0039C98A0D